MRCTTLAALAFAVPSVCVSAGASADELSTHVVSVSSAPVQVTGCRSDDRTAHVIVVNRTHHELLTFSVNFKAYDAENTLIGSSTVRATLTPPLTSGDSNIYTLSHWLVNDLSEPENALASITCRVEAAAFTGRKTWQYGQHWRESLLAVRAPGEGNSHGVSVAVSGPVQLTVLKSWNDIDNGDTYVHEQVQLTAGGSLVEIAPYEITLTLPLAIGGEKTFYGLNHAAPSYMKINPMLNQLVPTPEVDPTTDFGAIGRTQIPANGTATVIVTFAVSGASPSQAGRVAIDPGARPQIAGGSPQNAALKPVPLFGSSPADRSASSDARKGDDRSQEHSNASKSSPNPKPTKHPG